MDFETLKKKPAKFIMENNILDDVIYLNDNFDDLIKKVNKKIHKSFRDFLLVILNSQDKNEVQFIITHKEVISFMNAFTDQLMNIKNKGLELSKAKIQEIKLDEFKINFGKNAIEETLEVQKALDSIRENSLEVLVVINGDYKYVGKVKRSSLKNRIAELID